MTQVWWPKDGAYNFKMSFEENYIVKFLSMKTPFKFYELILISLILFNCEQSKKEKIELQEDKLNHILNSYVKAESIHFYMQELRVNQGLSTNIV